MRSTPHLALCALGFVLLAHPGSGVEKGIALTGEQAPPSPVVVSDRSQDGSCYIQRGDMEAARQRPSPLGETPITLNGQRGVLCYGRPSANGRVVMGELVPFGAPWRVGANEATALHLPVAASVGGVQLEPGSYSLFAIPGETEWEFVVNGDAERWGIPINDSVRSSDLGSFTVSAGATEGPVEQLTFTWSQTAAGSGDLVMEWEGTRVRIPIQASGG